MSNNGQEKRTCILVLGMHRSGTSALTGALTRVGIDGPATPMDSHDTNSKGFFESKDIWRFHENLLSSAGSSWDDWRAVDPVWIESSQGVEFSNKALELIDKEFNNSSYFVLKDPRVCRLVPFWINVFKLAEVSPVAFHIHRHPVEVAASLQSRDGFAFEYSYLLWLRHILDAELGSRQIPRIFTSFSRFLKDWPQVLNQAQDVFGIPWPNYSSPVFDEINRFITLDMKHHNDDKKFEKSDSNISILLCDSLLIMERWVQGEGERGDQDKLDEIRQELNAAADVFGSVLYNTHGAVRKMKKSNEVLVSQKDEILEREIKMQLEIIEIQKSELSKLRISFENSLNELKLELDLIRKERAAERLAQNVEIERVKKLESDLFEEKSKNEKLITSNRAELVVYRSEAKRYEESERNLALLRSALAKEKAARQDIYNSNSWKVTVPLRWASLYLRRYPRRRD
ncbi:hypothetical protein SAMN05444339_11336 [Loktanella atrilutea]|uniref:Sulfotransferase family protein n=1 Tax=Loktanella atrilutea TaxID=366533 RepID=A0A1M5ELK6_LOKAT|nr:hypothetical protein [Loktanella atrilutea]SHF79912.1 hypothetical protein SAMN05444339_11336 [Loktanella atrilutea]